MADEYEDVPDEEPQEGGVFTESTTESWFSRLGQSFGGICIGILLFFGSGGLLFWNEGRAAKRYASLKEGKKLSIMVQNNKVLPENEGKLIVVSGLATTDETLADPDFPVSSSKTLELRRSAEMYQWIQKTRKVKKKKLGGGETTQTEFSYYKQWSSQPIDSGRFYKSGYNNPGELRYSSVDWTAQEAKLGAFDLPAAEVERISSWANYPISVPSNVTLPSNATAYKGGFYLGKDPSYPQIGDIKVSYSVVKPTDITIVAQQMSNSFSPYTTKNGGSINLLKAGILGKEAMFQAAKDDNKLVTWLIRLGGMFLMYMGLASILDPIVVLADVLPFLGNILEFGVNLISGTIAVIVSLIIIAIAWIFYRPILAIILCVVSAGVACIPMLLKKKKEKTVESENATEASSLLV